jgi:methylated-DNA-[protein]-cysteine S-methyltransferase
MSWDMTASGYTLFQTPVGTCGIAWGPRGIAAVALPEASDTRIEARLAARSPGARRGEPSPEAEAAIGGMLALLNGEARDLLDIRLDFDGVAEFNRAVYDVTRSILPGETLTYGEVAKRIGEPGAARAVGRALGGNPFPIVVPCHRVLAAGGRTGGFSADGGIDTKFRLLAIERARRDGVPTLFDADPAFTLQAPKGLR